MVGGGSLDVSTLGVVGHAQLVDVAEPRVGAHRQVVLVAVHVRAHQQRHVAGRVPPLPRRRAVHAARHAHTQSAAPTNTGINQAANIPVNMNAIPTHWVNANGNEWVGYWYRSTQERSDSDSPGVRSVFDFARVVSDDFVFDVVHHSYPK